jgi:hypothetical protein
VAKEVAALPRTELGREWRYCFTVDLGSVDDLAAAQRTNIVRSWMQRGRVTSALCNREAERGRGTVGDRSTAQFVANPRCGGNGLGRSRMGALSAKCVDSFMTRWSSGVCLNF